MADQTAAQKSPPYYHIMNYNNKNLSGFVGSSGQQYTYVMGNKKGNTNNPTSFSELKTIFYMNSYGLPLNISEANFDMDRVNFISIENALGLHFYIKSPLDNLLGTTHSKLIQSTEGYNQNLTKYEWSGITVTDEKTVVFYFTQLPNGGFERYVTSQQVNL